MKKYIIYTLLIISAFVLFACSDGDNTPTINDSGLPPDPGEAGKLTIEGIDSDNDGVRDDIQRYIALTYENESTRKALTKYAKAQQSFLLSDDNKEKAIENVKIRSKATGCLRLIHSFDEAYQILDEIKPTIINTKERMRAYLSTDLLLSGGTFELPSDDELIDFCE